LTPVGVQDTETPVGTVGATTRTVLMYSKGTSEGGTASGAQRMLHGGGGADDSAAAFGLASIQHHHDAGYASLRPQITMVHQAAPQTALSASPLHRLMVTPNGMH